MTAEDTSPDALDGFPTARRESRPRWASVVGVMGIVFASFWILGFAKVIIMPRVLQLNAELLAAAEKTLARARGDGAPADLEGASLTDILEFGRSYVDNLEGLMDETEGRPRIDDEDREKRADGERSLSELEPSLNDAGRAGRGNRAARPDDEPLGAPFLRVVEKFRVLMEVPSWFSGASLALGVLGLLVDGFFMLACVWLLLRRPEAPLVFYLAATAGILLRLAWLTMYVAAMSVVGLAFGSGALLGIIVIFILLTVVATGDKSAFEAAPVPVEEPEPVIRPIAVSR